MLAAKQNQKFPFHFLSAPPTPPAELNKKGRKIFGFCPRESASAPEAQSERTIQSRATTRSARAKSRFPFEKSYYWCRGEDLNLHNLAVTGPSSLRVCQFRHPGCLDLRFWMFDVGHENVDRKSKIQHPRSHYITCASRCKCMDSRGSKRVGRRAWFAGNRHKFSCAHLRKLYCDHLQAIYLLLYYCSLQYSPVSE